MHCSGCGKNIPFGGQVCPFCQRDKSSDKGTHVAGIIAMFIGSSIGGAVGGFGGMIAGALIFALPVVIIGAAKAGHSAKKPPRVRIDAPASQSRPAIKPKVADTSGGDPATRLERLERLKDEGVITHEEYRERRAAIVATL